MGYQIVFNPFTNKLQYLPAGNILVFKAGVASLASLPAMGNTTNDARITADTGHMYVWDGATWQDQGDVIDVDWAAITNKPLDTDGTLAANSDIKLATQKATKTYVDGLKPASIQIIIDGSGAAPTAGIYCDVVVPFACTITSVELLADQSGSIVVDIWKNTYANFPPTVANTITASALPTLSSATKSLDSTLTGWTKSLATGDVLRFNINSATTLTRCLVTLAVTRT